jgi:hypothetical protein
MKGTFFNVQLLLPVFAIADGLFLAKLATPLSADDFEN